MKLEGVREFPTDRDNLWKLLLDPEVLARCLPGCEKLEAAGENEYKATLKVGIASIKGSFKGSVKLKNLEPTKSFKMEVQGSGGPGFVGGQAAIELEGGDQTTSLHYVADIQVGGLIAAVGQRMLQGISTTLMHQFFKAIEDEISGSQLKN